MPNYNNGHRYARQEPEGFDRRAGADRRGGPGGGRQKHMIEESAVADGPRKRGTIKNLVPDKGFGFIRSDDGVEYFFHKSATGGVFDLLAIGDAVEFAPMRSSKGPRAQDVERR